MELDAALLRMPTDIEVRGQPHDRSAVELDDRDAEVRRLRGEPLAAQVVVRSGYTIVPKAVTRRAGPNMAVRIVSG